MKARYRTRFATVLLLSAIQLFAPPLSIGAQEIGDSAAGQRLAERWCIDCHVIGPAQQRGSSYGAPPFEAIARMTSTTPMSLRVFLQTPHGRMPDLHLSREEIDDLVAYVLSLRRER